MTNGCDCTLKMNEGSINMGDQRGDTIMFFIRYFPIVQYLNSHIVHENV